MGRNLGRDAARVFLALVVALCGGGTAFAATASVSGPFVPDSGPGPVLRVAQLMSVTVTPYRWSARKSDDGSIVINGYVPDSAIQARLLAGAGRHALDASSIASGSPDGFAEDAQTALDVLQLLANGAVDLTGSDWRLSGSVADDQAAETVRDFVAKADLAEKGWRLDLALPEKATAAELAEAKTTEPAVDAAAPADAAEAVETETPEETAVPLPFGFAALKQDARWIVGGNAPIVQFQPYLDAHFGIATAGELRIVPAPQGFAATALAGLEVLKTLDRGRLYFDGKGWKLSGFAASEAVANAAKAALESSDVAAAIAVAEVPQVPVSEAETAFEVVEPPAAVVAEPAPKPEPLPLLTVHPFRWSAAKRAGGAIDFSGYVPADALKRYLAVRGGAGSTDSTVVATGAPDGFAGEVIAALDALDGLADGAVSFDGTDWSLTGAAENEPARTAIFSALGARADTWSVAVTAPEPPPAPLLTVHPFRWSAEKRAGGAIQFAGYVPNEGLKRYLAVRGGSQSTDTTALAAGAPRDFVREVLAALDALDGLADGTVAFDGTAWSLTGSAVSDSAKTGVLAALGERADAWTVAIAAPEPPPPPEPQPEPPPPFDKGAADFAFSADKRAGEAMVLTGDIPAEALRNYLFVIAGKEPSVAGLTARPGAPQDFVSTATAAVRALAGLDSGRLDYRDFSWSFAGKSASEPTRAAAGAALSALPRRDEWTIAIVSPTPLEICATAVAAFDTANSILFEAGSSRISQNSLPALDQIADALGKCPEATIHVEGHTDADGDDESNLILSVSRAEAVVERLIVLGIGEERLYAIGYGESLPIASNDTSDGKRRNRRIVFSVSEGTK